MKYIVMQLPKLGLGDTVYQHGSYHTEEEAKAVAKELNNKLTARSNVFYRVYKQPECKDCYGLVV